MRPTDKPRQLQRVCSDRAAIRSDHQVVMAHNNWTSYLDGERWRIIFDITPQHGQRILMDGLPGVITSDDDFGVNAAASW